CFLFVLLIFASQTRAQLFNGDTGQPAPMNDLLSRVNPGTVVLISEMHGHEPHHVNQRELLVMMAGASFPISVGMEFFDYTRQTLIDQYVQNQIAEDDFLNAVFWSGPAFQHYRFQVRFPFYRGGHTLGL